MKTESHNKGSLSNKTHHYMALPMATPNYRSASYSAPFKAIIVSCVIAFPGATAYITTSNVTNGYKGYKEFSILSI